LDENLLDSLAEQSGGRITEFDNQDIAQTLWAFSKLGMKDFPLL